MLRETPPNRSISENRHKWIGKVDNKRALGMYYSALGRKHLLHDSSPAPTHITKGLCGKIQERNRHKKLPAEVFGEPKTIERIGIDAAAAVYTLRIILGSLFQFFSCCFLRVAFPFFLMGTGTRLSPSYCSFPTLLRSNHGFYSKILLWEWRKSCSIVEFSFSLKHIIVMCTKEFPLARYAANVKLSYSKRKQDIKDVSDIEKRV